MKKTVKLLSLFLAFGLLTACGQANEPSNSSAKSADESGKPSEGSKDSGGQSSSESGPVISDGFTFDDDELNTPQEIHTDDQKAYLNFSKPYYEITGSDLNNFHATGASSLQKSSWAPKQVKINWEYGAPEGKTLSKFQLVYGQEEDLSDGYTVNGNKNNYISFSNPYLGDNYFKVIANFSDGSKEESPIKVFKVDDVAPRNLDVGNMPNCRDMGGRTTYAGGKIKQGMIYRTAGNKFDNRSDVDSDCINVLTNQLKVKTEINVANSTGNNVNLSGVKVENCFMAYGSVPYSNLARNSVRVRQIMDILSKEDNYPVFYHCRIGTDRTGITGVMINGLLGVPFNEVIQDYGFSNFSPIDNQRYPHKTPDNNGDDIAKYIDEIIALPGKNFQEQTYNALLAIGCPAEQLDAIIDIMTIGSKADISNSGKVGKGNDLSSTGNKKTASDFKNPDIYYECSSGKETSFTADLTAGNKDIVVYLAYTGNVTTSTSTKLSASIKLKIDGAEKTMSNTKNLWTAGFGSTQQDGRIGYMFNLLGQFEMTAGSHTVAISITSGTFNIATICVFDHVVAA